MTEVTREQFERYCEVQQRGLYNMLDPQAQISTGLDRKTYLAIINNYGELHDKYNNEEFNND